MSIAIGATLTSGIQDIAALLPLLGTEQCEEHVSSALDNGYFYAAATPMSIFGSLGLARAGFKAAIAGINLSFNNHKFTGAKKLADMGFHPSGSTLPLIMVAEGGDDISERMYLAEKRLQKLLEDLQLKRSGNIDISLHPDMWYWNVRMVLMTAFTCLLSIIPYVYLNMRGDVQIHHVAKWLFPAIRSVGGFLTSTMVQFVIQDRLITIAQSWLDHGRQDQISRLHYQSSSMALRSTYMWFYVPLLLIGVGSTIVGYVGCFSVVQSSKQASGPISWFGLEVALSIMRIILWGRNPTSDDAPPLRYSVTLRKDPPPPTCVISAEQIIKNGILPLARESEFIESITSFAGLIERFRYTNLTLYYTLTREIHENRCGGRVLYITILDQNERTTRIYTHDGDGVEHFYFSSNNHGPVINLQNQVLHAEIGSKILDLNNDPVFSDSAKCTKLKFHYQSILDQLHRRVGDPNTQEYIIENWWSMDSANATFMNEAAWREYMKIETEWNSAIYEGHRMESSGEDDAAINDNLYFALGRLDMKREIFIKSRDDWMKNYFIQLFPENRIGNGALDLPSPPLVLVEILSVEILVLWETNAWELLYLQTSFSILKGVDSLNKVPIWRDLKCSCLKRLKLSSRLSGERTRTLDNRLHDHMQKAWSIFIQRYEGELLQLLKTLQRDASGLIFDLEGLKFWDEVLSKSMPYTVRDLVLKMFSPRFPSDDDDLYRDTWRRVRAVTRDAEYRVRRSLEESCDPITMSGFHSVRLILEWKQIWFCPDDIWQQTELAFANSIDAVHNQLNESRKVFSALPKLHNVCLVYIKSLDIYSPEIVIDLLKNICEMPSVTSIVVDNSLISPSTKKTWIDIGLPENILHCLSQNKRLLSVSFDPLPDIERSMRNVVQENWTYLSGNTDFTFLRMNGVKGSGLSQGKISRHARIDVSFIGPYYSNLILRIAFHSFESTSTAEALQTENSNLISPFALQFHMNDYSHVIEINNDPFSKAPFVYEVELRRELGEDAHTEENITPQTAIDDLRFFPGVRTDLVLLVRIDIGYTCSLPDIQLLKDGLPWKPIRNWDGRY